MPRIRIFVQRRNHRFDRFFADFLGSLRRTLGEQPCGIGGIGIAAAPAVDHSEQTVEDAGID